MQTGPVDPSSISPLEKEVLGQIAVITGAGSGIGLAIARLLASHGAHIIGVGLKSEPLEEMLVAVQGAGGSAEFVCADVVESTALQQIMAEVATNHGALDILVNNAGVVVPPTPIAEFDERRFDRLMDVNVKGVFLGMRHALPIMIKQRHGVILNVGSVTSVKTVPGMGPYAASKRAVTALTRAAAMEVGPLGIRVNELLPGPTLTPMVMGRPGAPTGAEEEFARQVPLGRVSSPEEQAEAALFLVSRRSSYVNGASLLVDGGLAWI